MGIEHFGGGSGTEPYASEVMARARELWPGDFYYKLEYASCKFWDAVTLFVTDCSKISPYTFLAIVGRSPRDLMRLMEERSEQERKAVDA